MITRIFSAFAIIISLTGCSLDGGYDQIYNHLQVLLESNKTEVRPGDIVTLTVKLRSSLAGSVLVHEDSRETVWIWSYPRGCEPTDFFVNRRHSNTLSIPVNHEFQELFTLTGRAYSGEDNRLFIDFGDLGLFCTDQVGQSLSLYARFFPAAPVYEAGFSLMDIEFNSNKIELTMSD